VGEEEIHSIIHIKLESKFQQFYLMDSFENFLVQSYWRTMPLFHD